MFSNRIRITLKSVLGTKELKDDPINTDQSETEVGRSEKTFGIFLTETNNLEFTGEAKSWLENLYILKGPNAKCELIREEKHPTTDDWRLHSKGFLDFSTRKIKDNKLQIDFTEGGLREILTSQMREKFDLNRTTDINGNAIPELKRDILTLEGRDIFLLSTLDSENNDSFYVRSGTWRSGNDYREVFQPFPMNIVSNSDTNNLASPLESADPDIANAEGASTMFYLIADRDRGAIKLNLNTTFRVAPLYESGELIPDTYSNAVNASNVTIDVVLKKYTGGNSYIPAEETILQNIGFLNVVDNAEDEFGATYNINQEITINPKADESYAIGIKMRGRYGGIDDGFFYMLLDQYSSSLSLAEDSFYRRTNTDCLTAYDVGQRQSEIFTGEPCFESDLLTGADNTFLKDSNHQLVLTPGGWIRNIRRTDENGNVLKFPFEISFEDFYQSINAVLPVGYGIASIGRKQNIILEGIDFFFQRTVAINLGKIQITERTTAVEYCYQSLSFGYVKGGDYEQPLGLDEYNTQTNLRTPITISDSEYSALGASRTDSYGAEDARRKQAEDSSDEDTPYDKDNFLFDVKFLQRSNLSDYYTVRLYQDDFEALPTGIYSPTTAYNLNLSTPQNRKRHEKMFVSSFIMLQDEQLQHVNTKGNSELKTKKAGENPIKINDAVSISELANPIFKPEWIQAEAPFEQQIMDQVLGSTLINGKMVNNYYCLAEFINEKNRTEYAYIFTVKSKDKLTYKLLSAYGI